MTNSSTMDLNLRPFQAAAIQSLRQGLAQKKSMRQMLYAPTGAGKTVMAVGIVKGARAKGKRVAFVVNRVHLVEQTSAVFRKYGIAHGIIQSENTIRDYENVLVCSIQTLASRGVPDVDFIVIDEAHAVAGSKEYRALIDAFAGKPVIGLSATPFAKGLGRHYDQLDGPLFEQMVIASSIRELIEDGWLVDCDIYAPSEPDMSGVKQTTNKMGEMDFSDKDAAEASDKVELIGDIVSHWLKLANNTPTVVFASNIAHSKHIVEQFKAAGVAAEHIDYRHDSTERREALSRFASGDTKIISNSALLAEGWDAPFCETLILARPTKSLTRYLQMVGRVLRPFEGKEKALVLDHSGTVKRLGFPTDDLPLELDDGKPRTNKNKEQERDVPLPKVCTSCKFMKPARVHKCPACGFEPERQSEVEMQAGELTLVKKRPKATAVDKQQFYSEILAIQSMHGYSDGRIAHLYREKFGVWPKGLNRVAVSPSEATKAFIRHVNIRFARRKNAA